MSDSPVAEAIEPEEAFATLSDPTRVEIVRALWENGGDEEVTFSDIRTAVGVEDSGKFNYHLGELTDRFVRKIDDGYELTAAGIHVAGAILGGAYTMEGAIEPIPIDEDCPTCGGQWRFRYEEGFANFECDDCSVYIQFAVPPGTFVGADQAELTDLTERYLRTLLEQLRNRLCPYCNSQLAPRVFRRDAPDDEDTPVSSVALVEYPCTRCDGLVTTDLATPLLAHPAVVSFFHERGVDVREPPIWRFVAFDGERTSVDESDDVAATVRFEADGDELAVTVDESCSVHSTERV